ncbi:trypsin-like peptidase domain-containing protein [bacterium]|nr:trypsin-like peptidase domain-containing protein [bacterium]
MINKLRKITRGNAIVSLICGLAGVFIGAFILFIVLYTGGVINKKGAAANRPETEDAPRPTASASPDSSASPEDKDKTSKDLKDYEKDQASINYSSKTSALAQGSSIVADAVAKVAPAVVNIDTTTTRRVYTGSGLGLLDPFGEFGDVQVQEVPRGMGTGMIVSEDGLVLTNNHVVAKAQTITVTLNDKSQYKAKPVGTDPISDLAILRIENPDRKFPTVKLTNSESLRIGDWVVAIGNPMGVGQTATLGVLSARNRSLNDSNIDLRNLLQTDAAINPGNSGGPLINMNGEVIGINTAIISTAQGIGFAIPAEIANTVAESILAHGRVLRPYLGIEMAALSPAAKNYLGIDQKVNGVIIGGVVRNSPAEKGGLKTNDVIIAINGSSIPDVREIQAFIRSQKIGDKMTVKILREGKEQEKTITLEEMPSGSFRAQRQLKNDR